uniref:Uncharacterized protein n=1 Tax=Globodera rostochiensis TaxID=31243 RepID=A0A914HXV1_GLORO
MSERAEPSWPLTPPFRFFLHWKCAVPMRKCGVMPNRIKSSANLFSLDTVSAEVRLAKALDRETQQRHVLKMR